MPTELPPLPDSKSETEKVLDIIFGYAQKGIDLFKGATAPPTGTANPVPVYTNQPGTGGTGSGFVNLNQTNPLLFVFGGLAVALLLLVLLKGK